MGQSEILEILEKYKSNWLDSNQLLTLLKSTNKSSVSQCLARLRKHNAIEFKETKNSHGNLKYVYKYKK